MVDVTLAYPGVEIIDVSTPTSVVTPYGVCYMLISANKGTPKRLTEVPTADYFDQMFGDDSPSKKYVTSFFLNLLNNNVRLFVYRVNPNQGDTPSNPNGGSMVSISPFSRGFSTAYGDGTQTAIPVPLQPVLNDWLEAINTIDPTVNPGGIIIAPEAFETLNLQSRNQIITALNNFCDLAKDSYWLSIADLSPFNTSLSDAVTDSLSYNSPDGSVSVYQPFYYNALDVLLLPSAAMAAISLSIWSTGAYYNAPAGLDYTIKDCDRLGYAVSSKEYGTAHQKGINLIRYFVNTGFCPYDCITRSNAEEYIQIPSVVCFKIVAYLLKLSLLSLVFQSLKGEADLITVAEATINRVLFSCWQAGYLVGRNITDAYEVRQVSADFPKPSNATLTYEVGVRPAYSVIKYRVFLRNLLALPIA